MLNNADHERIVVLINRGRRDVLSSPQACSKQRSKGGSYLYRINVNCCGPICHRVSSQGARF